MNIDFLNWLGTFIINNGIGAFCIIYIIYLQNTTLKDINDNIKENIKSINLINQNLVLINDRLKIDNDLLIQNKKGDK